MFHKHFHSDGRSGGDQIQATAHLHVEHIAIYHEWYGGVGVEGGGGTSTEAAC